MTPHRATLPAVRSVAAALVLLAGVTGLLWPKSNIQAEDTIEPTPVRTLTFRNADHADVADTKLPDWLRAEDAPTPPSWTVRSDGLWVPWTMQPPAWWTTIAGTYVVAEAVPLPPERPKEKTLPETPKPEGVFSLPEPRPRRIARERDVCAQHGLTKVYSDRYRWRCQR